jgi:transcriptional regulator with XRE-family HTH domain
MSFASTIKQERERLGLTQAQAASLLSVSKSVIEKWEADTRTPLEITKDGALAKLRKTKPRKRTTNQP